MMFSMDKEDQKNSPHISILIVALP